LVFHRPFSAFKIGKFLELENSRHPKDGIARNYDLPIPTWQRLHRVSDILAEFGNELA
jgi:hypothetical protein